MVGKAKEIIFLVEESPEGGYEARALGYSIFTDGETLGEIKKNIRDAVHCHFDEENMPTLVRIHFVKDELITV
ncbi:MAG: 2-oxoisovalerate dehydrogenase [Thermotoga sp.]|nr:MAG: 2-oxoisovalerate dehydrogenase [Thermotoga sp.]